MESVQVKLEWENALRRVTVARNETLAKLKATIASLLGLPTGDCDVKYRDEENDLVTIGSDQELREVLEDHAAQQAKAGTGSAKILRLIVVAKAGGPAPAPTQQQGPAAPPQQPQQQPPQQQPEKEKENPDFPWSNLSHALSDPDVVQRLQHALQSPAITQAITRFARGYSETRGDVMLAGLMASQQVPALLNLLGELMEDLPVLKDLQQLILSWVNCAPSHQHPHHPHHPHHPPHGCPPRGGPFAPPFGFPFGGPRPPFPAPPQPPQQQEPGVQKHFGVFCDGCGSDEALKRASIAAGHQTRRGFIRGQRFKSQTVNDFDLCESCNAKTERFPDDIYGPFEVVAAPQGPFGCGRGGRGGGGGGWWRGAPHQHPWRHAAPPQCRQEEQGTTPKQEEEFDFIEAIRAAVQRGTEAFVEATNAARPDQGSTGVKDAEEIAKAIAESLKEAERPAKKNEEEAPPQQPQQAPQAPPAPSAPLDPFVKWNKQLSQLEALGFENLETYIEFLEQEKGDLDRVVARIVSRDL